MEPSHFICAFLKFFPLFASGATSRHPPGATPWCLKDRSWPLTGSMYGIGGSHLCRKHSGSRGFFETRKTFYNATVRAISPSRRPPSVCNYIAESLWHGFRRSGLWHSFYGCDPPFPYKLNLVEHPQAGYLGQGNPSDRAQGWCHDVILNLPPG